MMDNEGVLIFYVEQIDEGITSYSYMSIWNAKIKKEREVVFFGALPCNKRSLIVVTDSAAVYVKWEESCTGNYPNSVVQAHSFRKRSGADVEPPETRFTAAALTYDGRYLITSDSTGSVNVWNVFGGFEPIATFNGHVTSLDTYWHGKDFHLVRCYSHLPSKTRFFSRNFNIFSNLFEKNVRSFFTLK